MSTVPAAIEARATLDDLMRAEGKVELIGGRIVELMGTDYWAHRVAARIYVSLLGHESATVTGVACTDGLSFAVPELKSGRESFMPDAAFYRLNPGKLRRFIGGAPTFAVEVRSEGDYGPAAERAMAAKRADYFEAGTLVVWDVDPDAERIHCYRADAPDQPMTFAPGDVAVAEPAVPGWRVDPATFFA